MFRHKTVNKTFSHIVEELAGNDCLQKNKREFLAEIDNRKKDLFDAAVSVYGANSLSKLLTLKVMNLIVARYHFINRHTVISSRPLELMIDPSNSCQLHCPGCVHTANETWVEVYKEHWPPGVLSVDKYQRLLNQYAPYAFGTILCNYGEPMLNKNIAAFINKAVSYLIHVTVSSNMSLPKFDAEALVASGLNILIMSVDGTTQASYGHYRRGGDIKLVMSNISSLVKAKRKLKSRLPYLIWQYLTFEHNIHEMDTAIEMARDMGVDAFHILTPFDVNHDDPSIKTVNLSREEYIFFTPPVYKHSSLVDNLKHIAPESEFEEQWNDRWLPRMERLGEMDEPNRTAGRPCGWLYKNITMDALGRLLPCCAPPSGTRRLVYGNIDTTEDWFNIDDMRISRLRGFEEADKYCGQIDSNLQPPYCLQCPLDFAPPHDLWRIRQDLPYIDRKKILNESAFNSVLVWDKSAGETPK